MRSRLLLNIDLGEHEEEPQALYALADVAHVACGGHAGDEASMRRAIGLCCAGETRLGAHPSYPDREGFGRRDLSISDDAVRASVATQCAALTAIAGQLGERVASVKLHGALYHAAAVDPGRARAVLDGCIPVLGPTVVVVGPPAGALASAAAERGLTYWREGFADRAVSASGALVPRTQPGALITDPAQAALRARELSLSGSVETVCVHGDTPGALRIAQAVRAAIDKPTG
jgi:UPF0271 protein